MVPATDDQLSLAVADWNRRAAIAQQPAPAVTEGWKPVPVKPTIEMVEAGYEASLGQPDRSGHARAIEMFDAMLTAAPAAPEPAAQEPVATLTVFSEGSCKLIDFDGMKAAFSLPDGDHQLYTTPPAAEQPYSTTSDKYRAELYDEVLSQARLIGYANVTDALAALQRMKLAEHPDTVNVLTAAARDVLAERRRQVEAEGWTPQHDDSHGSRGLAAAAGSGG